MSIFLTPASGPSSNDDYLGHFKKLLLLTYLLTVPPPYNVI